MPDAFRTFHSEALQLKPPPTNQVAAQFSSVSCVINLAAIDVSR